MPDECEIPDANATVASVTRSGDSVLAGSRGESLVSIELMRPERSAIAAAWVCAVLLLGCGGSAESAPGGNQGGAGSASASGSSNAGSTVVGGGGAGGSTTASGGAGASAGASTIGGAPAKECSSYMDETGYSLIVQIKNERPDVIYVGRKDPGCDAERLFDVRDGAQQLLPGLEGCHSSCQQLMQSGPVLCPQACAAPSTIELKPGETLKVPWDGRFALPKTLPAECAATGGGNCIQAAKIEPSLFTFSAQAGTSRQCLAGASGCTCTPNPNGGCTAPGSSIGGTIMTTEYLVKLEPGEVSPGGEPPYIGLVFMP